ncbi:MAG: O-antigen ligase family protein [Chitinophagaceae bacterium]|nr:O-antigen ligase family protein [Chitinophagaceae bacterium]
MLEGNFVEKREKLAKDPIFQTYLFYFLIQTTAVFYVGDLHSQWKYLESQIGFIVLPLVLCSTTHVDENSIKKIMRFFNILIASACTYCLIVSFIAYLHTNNTEILFYHHLVSPLGHHAVYFSVFVFFNLLYLLLRLNWKQLSHFSLIFQSCLVGYYFVFLILLSSKLILIIIFVFLLASIVRYILSNTQKWKAFAILFILVLIFTAIISIDNPVKERFNNIRKANLTQLLDKKYNPGTSFTGADFRLLLWRLTYEILRDKHSLITGVGPTNSQPFLKAKYLSLNMYAGGQKPGDQGFLSYNCHNQFLQSWLQSGLLGVFSLFFWNIIWIRKIQQRKDLMLYGIMLTLFAFLFTESVFMRQYGMVLYTVFPLLFFYGGKKATVIPDGTS